MWNFVVGVMIAKTGNTNASYLLFGATELLSGILVMCIPLCQTMLKKVKGNQQILELNTNEDIHA